MTTYYISPTGNDATGNGSSGDPWATINKAHASAASGDTIICKNGTYTWSNQTFSKNLTILGETQGFVFLDGAAANVSWKVSAGFRLTCKYLIFRNSTSGGNTGTGRAFVANGSSVIINLENCIFTQITCVNNSGYTGSIFAAQAFTATSCVLSLYNCVLHNLTEQNTGTAIFVRQSDGIMNVNITNCTFYNSSVSAPSVVYSDSAVNLSMTIKNSIFYTTVSEAWGLGTAITYTGNNNLIAGYNGAPAIYSLSSDPKFVDASGGNFNLRPTSPCINAGALT